MREYTGGPVTEPGLYGGMPEDAYHSDLVPDGSLSVSGAKLLIPPVPPAKYKWARDNGRLPTKAQRLGTVTHGLALCTGQPVAVLEFDDRRTNKYKAAEAEALDAGQLPVLRKDYDEAKAIADALRLHPTAGALLEGVEAEVSGFWTDPEFGIWQRMRMDGMRMDYDMPTIVDLKTSKDASPEAFAKSVHEYGYFRQDPHYREGLAAALGCQWDDIDFIFIVVETEPPYLVATYRVSDGTEEGTRDDIALGREQMRIAREIFADCQASGNWPGYSLEIETLQLRRYDRQQAERTVNEWYR